MPRGGRSGIRDSSKACAKLIRPSTSSFSSSAAPKGVSGSSVSAVCIPRRVGGE